METKISLLENQIERLTNQIEEYKRQVTKLKENEKVFFMCYLHFFASFNKYISGHCSHFILSESTRKPFVVLSEGTLFKNGLIDFVEGTSIKEIYSSENI